MRDRPVSEKKNSLRILPCVIVRDSVDYFVFGKSPAEYQELSEKNTDEKT